MPNDAQFDPVAKRVEGRMAIPRITSVSMAVPTRGHGGGGGNPAASPFIRFVIEGHDFGPIDGGSFNITGSTRIKGNGEVKEKQLGDSRWLVKALMHPAGGGPPPLTGGEIGPPQAPAGGDVAGTEIISITVTNSDGDSVPFPVYVVYYYPDPV